LRWFLLLLLTGVLTAIIMRWVSLERWRWNLEHAEVSPVRTADPTPIPSPTATRAPVIGGKLETARLFSGITVNTTVEPTPGGPASAERADPQSYVLDLKLRMRVPTPNKTIEELAQVSPELPRLLPGLATMLTPESVSPFFNQLYETKLRRVTANLSRLDQILSRHNFYDCQTILQFKHPETQRRAVLDSIRDGCGCRWLRLRSPPRRQRHVAVLPAVHQLPLAEADSEPERVPRHARGAHQRT
jgi:hypothetical protein